MIGIMKWWRLLKQDKGWGTDQQPINTIYQIEKRLPFDTKMKFRVGGTVLFAGGYADRLPHTYGVCLEGRLRDRGYHDFLEWPDFSVPDNAVDVLRACLAIEEQLRRGNAVYIGCMGGTGRTGTLLAILAKRAGIDDPINYVRQSYRPHAIETDEQEQYVQGWPLLGSKSTKLTK